ncbi:DNA primase [Yersinia phage fHe-Yen8-01]|nr:DNA primase [Yersinia phage fHe-Yen8-01]
MNNNQPIKSHYELIDDFRSFMLDHDIDYRGEIEPNAGLQRFHVEGDKKGSINGWYILYIDEKPHGQFGCNKRYGHEHKIEWQPDVSMTPLTPEEKAEIIQKRKERDEQRAKERAEKEAKKAAIALSIWKKGNNDIPLDHPYLVAKQIKPYGLRCGSWSVWDEKSSEYIVVSDCALLVPLFDITQRNISSVQAIVPYDAVPEGTSNKLFLPGGAKLGRCFRIGVPQMVDGRYVFILCEGYATGSSIHEATGHCVIICFDSGNLLNVAKALAEQVKKSGKNPRFLIAGDDDIFTMVKGQPSNSGRVKGNEARHILQCPVTFPTFASLEGEPTDFNDLHCREGLAAVTAHFDAIFNPPPMEITPNPMDDDEEELDAEEEDPAIVNATKEPWAADAMYEENSRLMSLSNDLNHNQHFKFLGGTTTHYYFYVNEKKDVMEINGSKVSDGQLLQMAPLEFWCGMFPVPGKDGIYDRARAVDQLFRISHAVGAYDSSRVRAPGAWHDSGRLIFHNGSRALVNGVPHPLRFVPGRHVYKQARQLVDLKSNYLSTEEARHIREIALRFRWDRPVLANILVGWYFLAPICGVLRWRPHIWVTGPAGSGKSSILQFFADWLLDGAGLFFNGDSTEAGIRQSLRSSALPIVVDEFETNDRSQKMKTDAIMSMARQASSDSGAKTAKGSSSGSEQSYLVPSMFCLGSINTNIDKKADHDRFTLLDLLAPPDDDEDDQENWRETKALMDNLEDDLSFPDRWTSRAVFLMPEILKAVRIFRRVGTSAFGTQRNTDQLGTLMAGDYMLDHDEAPTEAQASAYLSKFNWDENRAVAEEEDARQALNYILEYSVRSGGGAMFQIKDLILDQYQRRMGKKSTLPAGLIPEESQTMLNAYGIKYDGPGRRVAFQSTPTPAMKKLISETSFATNLKGQLRRITGALNGQKVRMGSDNASLRCTTIPVWECINIEGEQDDLPL